MFNQRNNKSILLKKTKNNDCLVLGCTHYVFLKPFIKQLSNIKLIDGNAGIANNLTNILDKNKTKSTDKLGLKIILSNENQRLAKIYKKILSQTLANSNYLC